MSVQLTSCQRCRQVGYLWTFVVHMFNPRVTNICGDMTVRLQGEKWSPYVHFLLLVRCKLTILKFDYRLKWVNLEWVRWMVILTESVFGRKNIPIKRSVYLTLFKSPDSRATRFKKSKSDTLFFTAGLFYFVWFTFVAISGKMFFSIYFSM